MLPSDDFAAGEARRILLQNMNGAVKDGDVFTVTIGAG